MFSILLCEESIISLAPTILSPYRYDIVTSCSEIIEKTFQTHYDLYLVHILCYEIIKELKQSGDTVPTIFIDEYYSFQNLKKSYEIGDDYWVKPLYEEEIKIKIQYHYKKRYNHSFTIRHNDFYYHTQTKQLFKGKYRVKLSPNEQKIVALLFMKQYKPISKERLFELLENDSDGLLRVYMSKLKKLGLPISYDRSIYSYILE